MPPNQSLKLTGPLFVLSMATPLQRPRNLAGSFGDFEQELPLKQQHGRRRTDEFPPEDANRPAGDLTWRYYLFGITFQAVCFIGTFLPWLPGDVNGLYQARNEFATSGTPGWINVGFSVFSAAVIVVALMSRNKGYIRTHCVFAIFWYVCYLPMLLIFWSYWPTYVEATFFVSLGWMLY
jgi:hypothetical protein